MNNEINILLLDDEKSTYGYFTDAIKELKINMSNNSEHKIFLYNINIDYVESLNEAYINIAKNNYDFAIIDISLEGANDSKGLDFAKLIKKKHNIIPIAYTGQPNKIPNDDTSFYITYIRASVDINEVICEIMDIFSTGITQALSENGKIKKELTHHYHEIVLKYFSSFKKINEHDLNSDTLSRMAINYVYSKFIMNDSELNPNEIYIPSDIEIKEIQPGNIYFDEKSYYILVTPACSIKKNNSLILCEIFNFKHDSSQKDLKTFLECKQKKLDKVYKAISNNNFSLQKHYLPPSEFFEGGIVDFNEMEKIEKNFLESNDKFELICTVASDFMRNIQSRFSSYYARQGQPRIKESPIELRNYINNI